MVIELGHFILDELHHKRPLSYEDKTHHFLTLQEASLHFFTLVMHVTKTLQLF